MKKILTVALLLFIAPIAFVQAADVFDLGSLKDQYFGDTISVSWTLNTLKEDAVISVYLVSRDDDTFIEVASNKSRDDSARFIIPSTIPDEHDYKVQVTKDGIRHTIYAETDWFEILGERDVELIQDGSVQELNQTLISSEDDDFRINKFKADTKRDGKIEIEWKTDDPTNASLWATCTHAIDFYNEETGVIHHCPENEDVKITHYASQSEDELVLQPGKVNLTTKATFTLYALDRLGAVVASKEQKKTINPDKLTFDFGIVPAAPTKYGNSTKTENDVSGNDKVRQIIELAQMLDLEIDIDLIRLLVILEVL